MLRGSRNARLHSYHMRLLLPRDSRFCSLLLFLVALTLLGHDSVDGMDLHGQELYVLRIPDTFCYTTTECDLLNDDNTCHIATHWTS
jgi:hypothetical protein